MTYKKTKNQLHPRNKHQGQYDFEQLIQHHRPLRDFLIVNQYNKKSIDFFNPKAVKALNTALLNCYYQIDYWDIPAGHLCPPIPGRVDYLHYVADLLANSNQGNIPIGHKIKLLDIGVGANCIYPLLGAKEYGWSFVGADISKIALENAHTIIINNKNLHQKITLRWQPKPNCLFKNIVQSKEYFDVSICNPPFHSSAQEAQNGSNRKLKNLNASPDHRLNFGGQQNELWCEGGEIQFVRNMILESKTVANSVGWFTTLISKEVYLKSAYKMLKKVGSKEIKTIPMGQGNKKSRLLAWRF